MSWLFDPAIWEEQLLHGSATTMHPVRGQAVHDSVPASLMKAAHYNAQLMVAETAAASFYVATKMYLPTLGSISDGVDGLLLNHRFSTAASGGPRLYTSKG